MYSNELLDRYRALFSGWQTFFSAVFAIALLAAITISAQAQTFTGSISGTVTDQAGAVVPNATVTLTAVGTGLTRTTETNSNGEYNSSSLQPGAYNINVTASGFSATEISIQLAVAQEARVDAQLKIGLKGEIVQISAGEGGLLPETQNAELSNVVNQRQVVELPLITRNPYDLITLLFTNINNVDQHRNVQLALKFIF
jgi:Carboxypeptidase regulatory-like domain